jgi:outer membrane lipoprotein-sorting protein
VTRRLVYIAFGAAVGVLVVSRVTRAAQRLTPAGVQSSIAGSLSGLTDAVREFTQVVREGMAEREQELRVTLGLDGTHDLVDTVPGYTGGLEPDVR